MRTLEARETQEQQAVMEWWAYACHRWKLEEFDLFHIPNEGTGSRARGVLQKRQGLRPGCPDLMLSCPAGPYHGLFVEMKRAKRGKPSEEQLNFHARLARRGYAVAVCHGAEEAIRSITHYLEARSG